jgi:uncharacterized membrane-anchored protein YhcB (DUF1043 family)
VEQSLSTWLLPTAALLIGMAIGILIARLLPNANSGRTQQQLDDLKERFDNYQGEVVNHFNTTASLVKRMTQSYQDVQEHITAGASRLALDELTRQRLLAALANSDSSTSRERLTPPANNELPKDYAPQLDDSTGIDASFSSKNNND